MTSDQRASILEVREKERVEGKGVIEGGKDKDIKDTDVIDSPNRNKDKHQ